LFECEHSVGFSIQNFRKLHVFVPRFDDKSRIKRRNCCNFCITIITPSPPISSPPHPPPPQRKKTVKEKKKKKKTEDVGSLIREINSKNKAKLQKYHPHANLISMAQHLEKRSQLKI
jgi:hypothetical protein